MRVALATFPFLRSEHSRFKTQIQNLKGDSDELRRHINRMGKDEHEKARFATELHNQNIKVLSRINRNFEDYERLLSDFSVYLSRNRPASAEEGELLQKSPEYRDFIRQIAEQAKKTNQAMSAKPGIASVGRLEREWTKRARRS